jgi:hypothetical protein
MSNELVKWRSESLAARKIETALTRLRSGGLQQQPRPEEFEARRIERSPAYVPSRAAVEIVDLLRICAVHDKPYTARYIAGADGRFHYSQTIRVTEALYLGQYADGHNHAGLDDCDLAEECCPWCGGHGFGSVLCRKCGREICYGKTTGRYFRCRESCSGHGTLVTESRRQEGITPSMRQGGYRG